MGPPVFPMTLIAKTIALPHPVQVTTISERLRRTVDEKAAAVRQLERMAEENSIVRSRLQKAKGAIAEVRAYGSMQCLDQLFGIRVIRLKGFMGWLNSFYFLHGCTHVYKDRLHE